MRKKSIRLLFLIEIIKITSFFAVFSCVNSRENDIKSIKKFYNDYKCTQLNLDSLTTVNESIYVLKGENNEYFTITNQNVSAYKNYNDTLKHGFEVDLLNNLVRGWWYGTNTYLRAIEDSVYYESGIIIDSIELQFFHVISDNTDSTEIKLFVNNLGGNYKEKDVFVYVNGECKLPLKPNCLKLEY